MKLPAYLILKQFELGPIQNFLYFVGDNRTKEIVVIDPAWNVDFLCDEIEKNGYKVTSIFLTHGHPDHVNGLDDTLKRYNVLAYISKYEHPMLIPKHKNIVLVDDHAKLNVGAIEFECFHTPGHSPGCQIFKHENVIIAGDLIFIDGCGRCDLPGSDPRKMYHSLYDILMKFPDETTIFPGHNYGDKPYASLGELKKTNPYLTCQSKEEFLLHRMGFSL